MNRMHPELAALVDQAAREGWTDERLERAALALTRSAVPPMESAPSSLADGPHRDERTIDDLLDWTGPEEAPQLPADPAADPSGDADRGAAIAFTPAPTRKRIAGWTAERQRHFLAALAETGCVSEAAREVGISARSAYRLRDRPGGESFARAWVHAQTMAMTRLTAIAFERAVHGTSEYYFKDGVLVGERRRQSDSMLKFLLRHYDPVGFGWMEKGVARARSLTRAGACAPVGVATLATIGGLILLPSPLPATAVAAAALPAP